MRTLLSALLLAPALSATPLIDPVETPIARRAVADTLGDRLRRTLTPWLEEQAKVGAFSGVVLVAREGKEIYSSAWGLADREHGVPNTVETRFNLGSMNKMWTAIAVAQLAEQGKLDLDAPVGRYVPDLPNQAIRERVTVRHLLSHTAGMGSYFQNGFMQNHTYELDQPAAAGTRRPRRTTSRSTPATHSRSRRASGWGTATRDSRCSGLSSIGRRGSRTTSTCERKSSSPRA